MKERSHGRDYAWYWITNGDQLRWERGFPSGHPPEPTPPGSGCLTECTQRLVFGSKVLARPQSFKEPTGRKLHGDAARRGPWYPTGWKRNTREHLTIAQRGTWREARSMTTLFGSILATALVAQFQGGTIQGKVVDDQGKPVADAQVVYFAPPGPGLAREPVEVGTKTDAGGQFRLASPPLGRTAWFLIWAYRPGSAIALGRSEYELHTTA